MPRVTISTAVAAAAVVLFMLSCRAGAAVTTYDVTMTGAKELPSPGDPDAIVTGTLSLNNGTGSGTTGSATVSLTMSNLDFPLTLWHIHTGGPTQSGAPFIDFGNPETFRSGNILSGTITNLSAANITTVQANPNAFYFNIHNVPFGGGAVRDQVPEPSGLAVCGLAGLLLARRHRRP
jgi:hypothetical protein